MNQDENFTVLFEIGYSSGIYIDEYINDNEIIPLDEFILNFKGRMVGCLKFKDFIIELKKYNQSIKNKIKFIGIDLEYQKNIAEIILEVLKEQNRKVEWGILKENLIHTNECEVLDDNFYEKARENYLYKNFLTHYDSEKNYICFMGAYHTKIEIKNNLINQIIDKKISFLTLEMIYQNSQRTIKEQGEFKIIEINDELNEGEYLRQEDILIKKTDERIGKILIKNAKFLKML